MLRFLRFLSNDRLTATSGEDVDGGKTGASLRGLFDALAISSGSKALIACTNLSATDFLRL
jgi:hypothetical protein